MQLRALLAFAFFILINNSYAQDNLKTEFYVQSFNNNITVATPVISYNKEISTKTNALIKFTTDFVGQSVDGVSGASGRVMSNGQITDKSLTKKDADEEDDDNERDEDGEGEMSMLDVRKEITLNLNHHLFSTLEIKTGYDFSAEKDYLSHTPSLNLVQDLFEKNTTLSAGFARNMDSVHGLYMTRALAKNTNNYYLGLTQVLTPMTISQIGYSQSLINGFMPTGTKKVTISGIDYDEVMPNKRKRETYMARLNQFIPGRASIQFSYRYFQDDWKIKSHTGETEFFKYLGENLLLRLNFRYYEQTDAFFYHNTYDQLQEFFTAETQFGTMVTHLYGIKFIFNLDPEGLGKFTNQLFRSATSKLEFKFERYTQTTGISGNILMASLNWNF